MEQYPSNTLKERGKTQAQQQKPKPELKCVVNGKMKPVPKSIWSKVFVGIKPTSGQTMKEFIFDEIVTPLIQRAVVEGVTGAINFLVKGDAYADRKDAPRFGKTYINYNGISSGKPNNNSNYVYSGKNSGMDIENVWFESRVDGQRVLDEMNAAISQYDILTVNGFYDIIGRTSVIDPSNERFGWSDLRNAYITASRGGWVLHLPRPMPID